MMDRREFIALAASIPLVAGGCAPTTGTTPRRRLVRPGDPGWPSATAWDRLRREMRGELLELAPPASACLPSPDNPVCQEFLTGLGNAFYIRDNPALTQSTGWLDAWTSTPSAYAAEVADADDVLAAVAFAAKHDLRLVVRGGGHGYQGTSNAPDSLMIWTHRLDQVELHGAFVPAGCSSEAPRPAVTVGAGAIWLLVYDAVTTQGGRYVQGGGCTTVGVAGLVQSGGFGSLSKKYGLAAASLLEAEVACADGELRIANACTNPDLFWALRGGGGGSFGVVTRLTLATHELPERLGSVWGLVRAKGDTAYRELIASMLTHYRDRLMNPTWGEQIRLRPDNAIQIQMVFQGIDRVEALAAWQPWLDWIGSAKDRFTVETPLQAADIPARQFWNGELLRQVAPSVIVSDGRATADNRNFIWAGDAGEAGRFTFGYRSAWLPEQLLNADSLERLSAALFASTRLWAVELHFNKGLAGADPSVREAARRTAMNPVVADAFALAIISGGESPVYPGLPGHAPHLDEGRRHALAIDGAADILLSVAPNAGSYVAESSYFEADWRHSYWGENYARLFEVKKRYDPNDLFVVHNGVGSEFWSADGFERTG